MNVVYRIEPTLGSLEEEYRQHYLKDDIRFVSAGLIVAIPFVIVLAPNDLLLFGAYDPRAVEVFLATKPKLDLCGNDKDVAELESMVNAYNLKGALDVLRRIAEQLRITL